MRQRGSFLYVGSFAVLLLWFLTDPDLGLIQGLGFGATTLAMVMIILKSVLYICLLHIARKAVFDYFDFSDTLARAVRSPEGAGMSLIAVALMTLAMAVTIYAAVSN